MKVSSISLAIESAPKSSPQSGNTFFFCVVNAEKKDNANVFYEVNYMNIQYDPVITCIIHGTIDIVWNCSCSSLVKTNLSPVLEFRDINFFSVIPLKNRSKASNF